MAMAGIKKDPGAGNPGYPIYSSTASISGYKQKINDLLPGARAIRLRGYVANQNPKRIYKLAKSPKVGEGWKGVNLTEQEIREWINQGGWIGATIPTGYVVYDYDDKPGGEVVMKVLNGMNVRYRAIETPHGYQLILKHNGESGNTDQYNLLGIPYDKRAANKNYVVFPTENTNGRKILISSADVPEVDPAPPIIKAEAWHDEKKTFKMAYPFAAAGSRHNDFMQLAAKLAAHGVDKALANEALHQAWYYGVDCKDDGWETPQDIDVSIKTAYEKYHHTPEKDFALDWDGTPESEATSADGWEEPLMFDDKKLPTFDTDVLPDYCRSFVEELAEEMQVPVDMPAMAVLGVLSACVFGKFHVHVRGTWSEPLNLYTVIAMPPSSKKSPVHKVVTDAMRTYELNKREFMKPDVIHALGEIKAKEKAVDSLSSEYKKARKDGRGKEVLDEIDKINKELEELRQEAILPTYIIGGDATPEKVGDLMHENHERLSVISPEGNDLFSMLSGRYTDKPYLELYLQSYVGETYKMKRIRRDVDLENPLLSILLFVQNSVIENSDRSFKDRGLMQRFLYCIPESNLGRRKIRPALMSKETKDEFDKNIKLRMQWEPKESMELTLSEEADDPLKAIETTNEKLLGDPDVDDAYKEWRGKLIGNIIRIAGVLHVADWFMEEKTPTEISKDTFSKAVSLYGYLAAHAEKAFAISSGGEDDRDARRLYQLIMEKQKDGIAGRRKVQRGYHGFKNSTERLEQAEKVLIDRSLVNLVKVENKKAYAVNPKVLEAWGQRGQQGMNLRAAKHNSVPTGRGQHGDNGDSTGTAKV